MQPRILYQAAKAFRFSGSALLVTADKDFGELVFRQGHVHSGVMLLRLAGLSNHAKAELVEEVCRDRASELLRSLLFGHIEDLMACGPQSLYDFPVNRLISDQVHADCAPTG